MHKHEWGVSKPSPAGRIETLCGLTGTPFRDFEMAGARGEIDCPKCVGILQFVEAEGALTVPNPIAVAVA